MGFIKVSHRPPLLPRSPSPSRNPPQLTLPLFLELLNLGRSYPLGYTYFRTRLHRAFMSNSHLTTAAEIRAGIERAAFVRKGMFCSFFILFLLFQLDFGVWD